MKRDTTYRNADDPDQELSLEEKVKGYKYGPEYIAITKIDEELLKIPGPAVIKVIITDQ